MCSSLASPLALEMLMVWGMAVLFVLHEAVSSQMKGKIYLAFGLK